MRRIRLINLLIGIMIILTASTVQNSQDFISGILCAVGGMVLLPGLGKWAERWWWRIRTIGQEDEIPF